MWRLIPSAIAVQEDAADPIIALTYKQSMYRVHCNLIQHSRSLFLVSATISEDSRSRSGDYLPLRSNKSGSNDQDRAKSMAVTVKLFHRSEDCDIGTARVGALEQRTSSSWPIC